MTTEARKAAYALLEALDDIDIKDPEEREQEILKAIRRVARPSGLDPTAVWREACDIERDPLERHREIIGAWAPNLR